MIKYQSRGKKILRKTSKMMERLFHNAHNRQIRPNMREDKYDNDKSAGIENKIQYKAKFNATVVVHGEGD